MCNTCGCKEAEEFEAESWNYYVPDKTQKQYETDIKRFKKIARKYGFKAYFMGDGRVLLPTRMILQAKNTDGEWTDWFTVNLDSGKLRVIGNTDQLNLWFYRTRRDMTPRKLVRFVKEINAFITSVKPHVLVRHLIDPEDYQELKGTPNDAYDDERYFMGAEDFGAENDVKEYHMVLNYGGLKPQKTVVEWYDDEFSMSEIIEEFRELALNSDLDSNQLQDVFLIDADNDEVKYAYSYVFNQFYKGGVDEVNAETFEAPIMPFNRSGRPCPSCRSWSQSFIGGVCSRCASKDRKKAENYRTDNCVQCGRFNEYKCDGCDLSLCEDCALTPDEVPVFSDDSAYVSETRNELNRKYEELCKGCVDELTEYYKDDSYDAETFEAREDLICDYCEKIISPDEGSVNWPDSGLTVCDDCFDDAIKNAEEFEATKGMDTYAQPLEELKIKPTKTKVGILLTSIVAGGLWYSNKMKE